MVQSSRFPGFVNNAFQEVAKYYVMDQHEISPNLILFSEATWNQLSQEDRDLIEESFQESVPYFEELSDSKDAEYLKTIEDAGTEIVQVDVSEWQMPAAAYMINTVKNMQISFLRLKTHPIKWSVRL